MPLFLAFAAIVLVAVSATLGQQTLFIGGIAGALLLIIAIYIYFNARREARGGASPGNQALLNAVIKAETEESAAARSLREAAVMLGLDLPDAVALDDVESGLAASDTALRLIQALGHTHRKQRLDSTHIMSNIATLTRLGLFCETMRLFLRALRWEHPELRPVVPEGLLGRYLKEEDEATHYEDAHTGEGRRRLSVWESIQQRLAAAIEARQQQERRVENATQAQAAAQEGLEAARMEWQSWLAGRGLAETLTPETMVEFRGHVETARVALGCEVRAMRRRIEAIEHDIDEYKVLLVPLADTFGLAIGAEPGELASEADVRCGA